MSETAAALPRWRLNAIAPAIGARNIELFPLPAGDDFSGLNILCWEEPDEIALAEAIVREANMARDLAAAVAHIPTDTLLEALARTAETGILRKDPRIGAIVSLTIRAIVAVRGIALPHPEPICATP